MKEKSTEQKQASVVLSALSATRSFSRKRAHRCDAATSYICIYVTCTVSVATLFLCHASLTSFVL